MDKTIIEQYKSVLKNNLICIASYGKHNTVEENYFVVVEKIDFNVLSKVKPIITDKLPLFMTHDEIKNGMDVFPLEFLHMKNNHLILYGKDIFEDMKFNKQHVRRQLEFEFRSKLINLREGYLQTAHSRRDLHALILTALGTLMPIYNGLLYLKNIEVPWTLIEIFDKISQTYKVDMEVLKEIYEIKKSNEKVKDHHIYIDKLIKLLTELAVNVDKIKI